MPVGTSRPPAAAAQHRRLAGHEVGTGVAGPGVGRQRQVGVEADHRDVEHAAIIAARATSMAPSRSTDSLPNVLVWMDLEMTGLDPATDVIVEIATLVTDDELEIVAEGPDLVVHQPPTALAAMGDVVREMHTRSGLLPAIEASTIDLAEAGEATLAFIREHVPEPRTVPLCGNSIGTDRRFLAAYLPDIENYLHYRSVDVSTVKELARRWAPDVVDGRAAQGDRPPGARRHPRERRPSCAGTATTCSS